MKVSVYVYGDNGESFISKEPVKKSQKIEVDESFMEEYERALREWSRVQNTISEICFSR